MAENELSAQVKSLNSGQFSSDLVQIARLMQENFGSYNAPCTFRFRKRKHGRSVWRRSTAPFRAASTPQQTVSSLRHPLF
jgi:hypothetical protein